MKGETNPETQPHVQGSTHGTLQRTLGQWRAWCADAPASRQAERLEQVPEQYREDVRRHLAKLQALAAYHRRKAKT